jgi:DNA-binding GntR family transcriptional regulator
MRGVDRVKGARSIAKNSDRAATGAELAFKLIFDAILEGRLKPGMRVTESSVAKDIGLSRTPVREAMRRLEANGLLLHQPHRGMVITKPDHQMTIELYQVREVLEGAAAAMAAQQASEAEIELLREIIQTGRRIPEKASPAELARNNAYFHSILYRSAHNRYLLRTLGSLQDSLMLLGPTTLSLPGRRATAFDEHDAIVSAIFDRNPSAAEAAARSHIRAAQKARLQLLFQSQMDMPVDLINAR